MELKLGKLKIQINWLVLLCFMSSMGMFISLAAWQLDRAEQKQMLADALENRSALPAVPFDDAADHPLFGDQFPVTLTGRFENSIPFLKTFQFFRGQAGLEVVTPFRRQDGSLVLVSRGWVATANNGGEPDIPVVEGDKTIVAKVYVPQQDIPPAQISDNSWPVTVSRLNVAQAERLLGEPLYPYVLRLEERQPGVLSRHWSAPRISIRTHIGYAIQWALIAVVVALAALLLSSNALALWRSRHSA
ncbi:SURF1-like protein [Pseudohongiella nitratireducens]|jgi:cytochrome oxidase assembly protein ShyY1|uniref:SURF1-like protein n=1 Tax=Pseudohongiella nitratireducens TaxID=1768907 RepID=A0A917GPN9_9GAMM|nr:SURF1 family protein [Pseudohongiella nitratireducens]MDF1623244.1 SURF1 family protein [Pseudohongiella nitratireducens]GGG53602.1 SURF1-like protein [Pseudohongiella nitratireducens]|tara:strand:- start:9653 stop:10390 length:738 start_codon:yes stop_codon:yes gene_type:complete